MSAAPAPQGDVAALIPTIRYKPGWTFKLGGPERRFLCVFATTPDSLNPARERCTQHMFEIPDPSPLGADAARWIFDHLLLAELHEAGEFFDIAGHRPYFPHHQDEGSPYELPDRWAVHPGG